MPDDDRSMGWRVTQLEVAVGDLRREAVSREWLDERIGRLDERIAGLKVDIAELKVDVTEKAKTETSRRNGTYLAVVGAVLALAVSLLQQVP